MNISVSSCLTLDEQRRSERRVFPCTKPLPAKWTPNKFSQSDLGKVFFDRYFAKYLLKTPVKLLVIAFTLAVFGLGVYGASSLVPDYNAVWYMRDRCVRGYLLLMINSRDYCCQQMEVSDA